jgi:hypothetical protein
MNHLKITNTDDLLTNAATPRLIEAKIIDYIMSLRNDEVAYSTIKAITNPILTFYQLNDVLLNRKKVYWYLGEFRRVVKDTAYTGEQILQMLQNADQRILMLILILSSTGCSSNTPLIRQQFDINDTLQVRNPQPLRLYSLRNALENHLIWCGIRTVEHPIATNTNPNSSKRVRKSISLSTGFRKHRHKHVYWSRTKLFYKTIISRPLGRCRLFGPALL